MRKIILLDICGTIFDSNTTFDFLDHNVKTSNYKLLRRIMYTLPWKIINKLSIVILKYDLTRNLALKNIKGHHKADLEKLASTFYDNILSQKVNKKVIDLIEKFKNNDYKIIITSATLDFIAKTVAHKLNITEIGRASCRERV